MSKIIELKNVSKYFQRKEGFRIKVISNFSLAIEEGEAFTILGQKGAGKSVLLKILSNIYPPSEGSVFVNSKFAYLPSAPSSFPWLTPFENIKFVAPDLADKEISNLLELLGLEGYEKHYPISNSYGFRLRITIARALALNPKIIIFDEPFNLLENDVKLEIFNLLKAIKRKKLLTYVFATSNVNEALYLSDRIVIIKGEPAEIIDEIDCSELEINEANFNNDSKINEFRFKIQKSLVENINEKFFNISL